MLRDTCASLRRSPGARLWSAACGGFVCLLRNGAIALFLVAWHGCLGAPAFGEDRLIDPVTAGEVSTPSAWTDPARCGTNCLYAFLKLEDIEPDYESLALATPLHGSQGSSLAELAAAAEQFGASVAVRQVRPSEMPALPVPFILHLDLVDVGGTGHFITVFAMGHNDALNDPIVRYVDGGTGFLTTQQLQDLSPLISGFVLIPNESSGVFGILDRISMLGVAGIAFLISLPFAVFAAKAYSQ